MKQDFFDKFQDRIFELARQGGKRLSVLIAALMKRMETDNGVLKQSRKNAKILSEVIKTIRAFYKNQTTLLSTFLHDALTELVSINVELLGKEVKTAINEKKYLTTLLTDFGFVGTAIKGNSIVGTLLKDDVTSKTIIAVINKAVRERSIIKDLIKVVTDLFTPSKGLGLIEKQIYHKGGFNLLQQQDRILSDVMAEDLGLNYAVYAGTVKDNTRDFCKHRVNKVYTRKEIVSWNRLTWNGKIPNSDILVTLGGFGCRHHLNFVSEETAKRLASTRGGINSYH